MGIDPAPFWANLFLYAYENNFMTDLISTDKVKARRFHSTKRFIDDLCVLNDGGEFCRDIHILSSHSSEARRQRINISIKTHIF